MKLNTTFWHCNKIRLLLNKSVDDFITSAIQIIASTNDIFEYIFIIEITFNMFTNQCYRWTLIRMSNEDTLFIFSTLSQNHILDILYWLKFCFRFIKINSIVARHHRGNHTENSRRRSHISISGNKVATFEDLVTPRNSTHRGNVFIVIKMLIID